MKHNNTCDECVWIWDETIRLKLIFTLAKPQMQYNIVTTLIVIGCHLS